MSCCWFCRLDRYHSTPTCSRQDPQLLAEVFLHTRLQVSAGKQTGKQFYLSERPRIKSWLYKPRLSVSSPARMGKCSLICPSFTSRGRGPLLQNQSPPSPGPRWGGGIFDPCLPRDITASGRGTFSKHQMTCSVTACRLCAFDDNTHVVLTSMLHHFHN